MTTIGQGFAISAAIVKKTAKDWGKSATNVVSGNKLYILSEGVSQSIEYITDESLNSTPWRFKSDLGPRTIDGPIELYGRYEGLELFLWMLFGRENEWSSTGLGAGPKAYPQTWQMKPSVTGYYCSFAMDKIVGVAEFGTVKVKNLTISGDAGQRVKFSFGMLGDQMVTTGNTYLDGSSITADASSVQSAGEVTPRVYMMMRQAKFRINAQNGAAFAASDNFYPSSFSVVFDRNLGGILQSSGMIDEPESEGFGSITGSFGIPTYSSDNSSIEDAYINDTVQKMDIRIQSSQQIPAVGGGAYYYAFNMYFPEVKVTKADRPVGGPGRIAADFDFEAFAPSGTYATTGPDGMDGNGSNENGVSEGNGEARNNVNVACMIEVINTYPTDPAA